MIEPDFPAGTVLNVGTQEKVVVSPGIEPGSRV